MKKKKTHLTKSHTEKFCTTRIIRRRGHEVKHKKFFSFFLWSFCNLAPEMDKPVKDAGCRWIPAHYWFYLRLGVWLWSHSLCKTKPAPAQPVPPRPLCWGRTHLAWLGRLLQCFCFFVFFPPPQQSSLAAADERDKRSSVSEICRPISSGRNLHSA